MTSQSSIQTFERDLGNGHHSLNCILDGIHCGACTLKIENHIGKLAGVVSVRANATSRRLRLVWKSEDVSSTEILDEIDRLGFSAKPFEKEDLTTKEQSLLIPLSIAGFGTMNIMVFSFAVWSGLISDMGDNSRQFMHWLSAFIAVPVIFYSAYPFYIPAFQTIKAQRITMDTPITLAIFVTLFASLYETYNHANHVYYDAAVSLVFFLLIGRALDQMLRKRSSLASENLRSLGHVLTQRFNKSGEIEHVLSDQLKLDDLIFVPLGERVGADGVLTSEFTEIDESIINGETLPRRIGKGENIVSGSIITGPAATIKVTAVGQNTRLSAIADLVDNALSYKGKAQTLADKFSQGYGPFVIGLSLLGFLFWYFILNAGFANSLLICVAVLVVTCPCAAGLATPAVMVRAVNQLLKQGVLVKSGDALERLSEVSLVTLDKTGTLTNASFELAEGTNRDALKLAASMAAHSHHPLSKALVKACPTPPLAGVKEIIGEGLVAPDGMRLGSARFTGNLKTNNNLQAEETKPVLWFTRPGHQAHRFHFRDTEKKDAKEFVSRLNNYSLECIILSGDKKDIVSNLASRLGITQFEGELSPENKLAFIKEKQSEGAVILMVGDGLNDAPALSLADVSIAPASATDISQSSADLIMIRSDLLPIVTSIETSRKAAKLIKQNLIFAALYNIFTVPIALAGGLTPLIASILMSSSSILVMLNAQRLKE